MILFSWIETAEFGYDGNQRRSMHSDQCAVFLRDACVKTEHTLYVIPRRDEPLTSYLFNSVFHYNLPIVEGKYGLSPPLFFLSFSFFFT